MENQSSFIPKTNNSNRVKKRANIFFISLLIYSVFFGTVIAGAATFIYEKHTLNQVRKAVVELDGALKSFNQADFLRVQQFDRRLAESSRLFANSVSLQNLFSLVASSTPQTVELTNLTVERQDTNYLVSSEVLSDSFEAVLFYRDSLRQNMQFSSSSITDITYQSDSVDSTEEVAKLTYAVDFIVPVSQLKSSNY
jgi:hypothetical protein